MRVHTGDSRGTSFSFSRHARVRRYHSIQYGERLVCANCAAAKARANSGCVFSVIGFLVFVAIASTCSKEHGVVSRTNVSTPHADSWREIPANVAQANPSPAPPQKAQERQAPPPPMSDAKRACLQRAIETNSDMAKCK
jgi:hypothetical protein